MDPHETSPTVLSSLSVSSHPVWPHQLHRLRHACLLHNGLDLFRILHLWRHAHIAQSQYSSQGGQVAAPQ